MEIRNFDCVVVGSGIAGLSVAMRIGKMGYKVALFAKGKISDTNTFLAQGGVAAVIGDFDSFEKHITDTMVAGDGLCRKRAVEYLVEKSPFAIEWLEKNGVRFNKNNNGRYALGMEGGHSENRIVHHFDYTGREIQTSLERCVKNEKNISVFENFFCYSLHKNSSRVNGVFALNRKNEKNFLFMATYTVLCTGGLGRVYSSTTNQQTFSGDGYVMALQAGASLANMEFVQFHPTSFYNPKSKGKAFLISEALRGAGAVLKDTTGNEIMKGIHHLENLAPRDIVARRIFEIICRDGSDFVYLDAVGIGSEKLISDYPDIYSHCKEAGIDITKNLIPVSPSAHYSCGGINSSINGTTAVEGLLVCGETAYTGVHGANRLASNSLLEGVVFSESVANFVAENMFSPEKAVRDVEFEDVLMQNFSESETRVCGEISNKLVSTATKYAGIVRSNNGLGEALKIVDNLKNEFLFVTNNHKKRDIASIELFNLLQMVEVLVKSSILRCESRGVFFNSDYPQKSQTPYESKIYLDKGEVICKKRDM